MMRLVGADFRMAREYQRFDYHRDRAGIFQNRADVNVIELLQFQPVDGDDRVGEPQFLAAVNTEQAADVAVTDENKRMAAVEHRGQSGDQSAAQRIEALERRRSVPGNENGHGNAG